MINNIHKDPRVTNFYGCIQCGKCTAACPAARVTYEDYAVDKPYNPREITLKLLLCNDINNDINELVNELPLDKCFNCYTCKSVCPKGNSVSDIVKVLREAGRKEHNRELYDSFYETGLSITLDLLDPDGFDDWIGFKDILCRMGNIRKELGLDGTHRKVSQDTMREIRKIADLTKNIQFRKIKEHVTGKEAHITGKEKRNIPRNGIYLFKSCMMDMHYPGATKSMKYILDALEINYIDDPRQSCCTGFGYYADAIPFSTALIANARNFALAEEGGYKNIATVCVTSYGMLRESKEILETVNTDEIMRKAGLNYKGEVNIYHISEIFYHLRDRIKAKIKHDFSGIRVATHHGCHYTKMFRQSAIPNLLDDLASVTGAEIVDYREKDLCCGMGFDHALHNRDYSRSVAYIKLRSVMGSGAELVVYACPGCQITLDRNQRYIEETNNERFNLAHINHAQLIALAMGADPYKVVGIQTHSNRIEPILERIGVL